MPGWHKVFSVNPDRSEISLSSKDWASAGL